MCSSFSVLTLPPFAIDKLINSHSSCVSFYMSAHVSEDVLDTARINQMEERESQVDQCIRSNRYASAVQTALSNPPLGTKNADIKVSCCVCYFLRYKREKPEIIFHFKSRIYHCTYFSIPTIYCLSYLFSCCFFFIFFLCPSISNFFLIFCSLFCTTSTSLFLNRQEIQRLL